ncbi:MAG: UDP-N-acetylglucosamine 1-carboxyvinyltransferase [Patescibacteria group bacterium]
MQQDTFVVEGLAGKPGLTGTVKISGAKNHVLKVMAAAALIEGESKFENVPGIADVDAMGKLLEGLGAFVTKSGSSLTVSAKRMSGTVFDAALAKSLRASIVLTGPILARMGSVTFPHPGGDIIGERAIDVFLSGFEQLGAAVSHEGGTYTVSAPKGLSGGEVFFRVVSVTGTETLMMAATFAKAPVVLKNCAMEPEVVATAEYLKACGAKIDGVGGTTIIVHPSSLTPPPEPFSIIPDRIEAGSFLALGAMAGKDLTIQGVVPQHLDALIQTLWAMGVPLTISGDAITLSAPEKLLPVNVRTHEYPGFPTDAQAPFSVLLTQAEGESVVVESIFDGRLAYTTELVKMGANISLISPHRARVTGKTPLSAITVDSPDIRAGLALVLAAVIAKGQSTIGNVHLIDRGYEGVENKLAALGLSIKRVPGVARPA